MTRDDLIRIAVHCCLVHSGNRDGIYMDALEDFANLVAAAEREACADICTQAAKMSELAKEDLSGNETGAICFVEGAVLQANKLCAAILARGQE